ncbi:uncharacterized protein arhgef33 isoform X2 [Nelusetta ayraudi]|uniref:uncharacterized protein arhgef33 isoform X2 n=1 Tax=Nelusetta ayraudi TaxID=303726 RepID=UPI003F705CD2
MENGKTETEDMMEDKEDSVEDAHLEIAQLQGLVAELREGLHAALTAVNELRQRDHGLEDKIQAHQTDVDDKIMGLKNSLNTFKEELSVALFHVKDVSSRQREVQRRVELLQAEGAKELISVPRSRKSSRGDVLTASGEEQATCTASQADLSALQHFFCSLQHSESPQRSSTSTQTSSSDHEGQRGPTSRCSALEDTLSGREASETPGSPTEHSKRHRVALELLESERVYVSQLSLLLKANITFNGSDAFSSKDKRPFPSSLRFLIQQHLDLLHALQDRVLKCQWQGIVGDVFMKLGSNESDFLTCYLSYLKELPECLSVISLLASGSVKSFVFLECDITGDESKPSLHNLLLQPVQRIPEYLLLLQALLKQTEAEHPDYYLLLVCIQQFRSFTVQYHHLVQRNQELLVQSHKEAKRSSMKQLFKTVDGGNNIVGSPYPCSSLMLEHSNQVRQSKQRLLEQIQQIHRFQEWDRDQDPELHCYGSEWPSQLPFYNPELDPRNHKPSALGSIPEAETPERPAPCQHQVQAPRPEEARQVQPGSALADALQEFLLPPDPPGMESLYEEDGDSYHDASVFDRCSSASSDSSIDIAFVKCPKAPSASHHALAANISATRDVFSSGRIQSNGYNKLPNRGCVSPDESVLMRRNQPRPLQASQRKSKSLNGLQMDNVVNMLDGPQLEHLHRVGMGSHAKLERQGSKGSKGCPTPVRQVHCPLGNRAEADKDGSDHHGLLSMDSGFQSWGEETKWRGGAEECNHTPLSERSRKQEKGGFRSSFKKLFRKKGGDDKKEKSGDKTPEHQASGEHEASGKTPKLAHVELNRGTAV